MKSTESDTAAPIRSFEQIAERLQEQGDYQMDKWKVRWHHDRAMVKLRRALEEKPE